MFSNLTQGSILYGYDAKETFKYFTAPIVSVSLPRLKNKPNGFYPLTEMVVDIVATVNGERREFQQVPSNTSIADFGENAFVIADSKEALNAFIDSQLMNVDNRLNNIEKDKHLKIEYESLQKQINPNLRQSVNDDEVKDLREKVNSMEGSLKEILSLLKPGNNKNE